ncbi:hypothetical protein FF1_006188 [Malus domestica]
MIVNDGEGATLVTRGGSTVGSSGSHDPLETMETTLKLPYATSWSWGRRGIRQEEEEEDLAAAGRGRRSSKSLLSACSLHGLGSW